MDNFEDLREVLSAIQEVGNAWQNENVSLKATNAELRTQNDELRTQNETLRREVQNLSDEVRNLEGKLDELRDEVIKQLKADKDDNQRFIRKYFGANVSSVATQTDTPSTSTNTDITHDESTPPTQPDTSSRPY